MTHKLKDATVAYLTDLSVLRIDETVGTASPVSALDKPSLILHDVAGGQFPAAQVHQLPTDGSNVELLLHLTLMDRFQVLHIS